MSRQHSPERIERVLYNQRKNHLYKLIAQYRFRNSTYFKVSKFIRIFFIGFCLVAIFFNTTVIYKQFAYIKNVEVKYDKNIGTYSLRNGGWSGNKPYYYTIVTTNKNQFELHNSHDYLKEYDIINQNRNILGKFSSIEFSNIKIPLSKPNKWRDILLFISIFTIFTFIYNDYQRKELRILCYFFTFVDLTVILLYYLLL